MNNYLEKFKNLEAEISKHKFLDLIECKYFPAASDAEITKAEKAIGRSLPQSVKEFYSQTNGFKISWRFKNLPKKDWDSIISALSEFDVNEKFKTKPFGVINILSLDKCFINPESFFETSENGDFSVEFNGKTYPGNSFGKILRPVDLYSDHSCMSFVLEDQDMDKIMQLSDGYIVWDFSKVSNFDTYLEVLFITRGIIESRDKVYREYRGDNLPPIKIDETFIKDFTPKIFTSNKK